MSDIKHVFDVAYEEALSGGVQSTALGSGIAAVFEAGRTAALAEIREQGKLIVDAGELRQLRAGYDTLVEAVEHAPAAIEYLRSVNWGGSVADWERGSDV